MFAKFWEDFVVLGFYPKTTTVVDMTSNSAKSAKMWKKSSDPAQDRTGDLLRVKQM